MKGEKGEAPGIPPLGEGRQPFSEGKEGKEKFLKALDN